MIRIIWEIIRLVFLHKMVIKEGNHFLLPVNAKPACMHVLLVPFGINSCIFVYNEPVHVLHEELYLH